MSDKTDICDTSIRIHTCATTLSYVCHNSFIWVYQGTQTRDVCRLHWLAHAENDSCVCVTPHIHMYVPTKGLEHATRAVFADSPHSGHDSCICVTHHIHMCAIHMCDTTHSYVWHNTFTCVYPETQTSIACTRRETFAEYVLLYRALLQKRPLILRSLLILPRDSDKRCVLSLLTMGWLQLVGSLKL